MITFRRRTLREEFLRLFPRYRRQQDAALKEAIKRLVDEPDLPCKIDGVEILDGFGYSMRSNPLDLIRVGGS